MKIYYNIKVCKYLIIKFNKKFILNYKKLMKIGKQKLLII